MRSKITPAAFTIQEMKNFYAPTLSLMLKNFFDPLFFSFLFSVLLASTFFALSITLFLSLALALALRAVLFTFFIL